MKNRLKNQPYWDVKYAAMMVELCYAGDDEVWFSFMYLQSARDGGYNRKAYEWLRNRKRKEKYGY